MEMAGFSEKLVVIYKSIRRHILQGSNLHVTLNWVVLLLITLQCKVHCCCTDINTLLIVVSNGNVGL
jgi:hypothetical protein